MITCFGTSHPWIQQLLPEKMFWFSALTFLWNKAKDNNNKFKHEINYFVTAIFMFNSKIKNNNQVQSWASFLGLCSNMKQLPFHRFLWHNYVETIKKLEETIEAKAKQQQQQIFAIQWEIVSVNPVKKFSTSKRHVHNPQVTERIFPFSMLNISRKRFWKDIKSYF